MKQFAVAALAGAVALISGTDARQMHAHGNHSHSVKAVKNARKHLETVYGRGLVNLYDDTGKLQMHRLKMARKRPAMNWVDLGGITFDAETGQGFLYGFSTGLQYTGMSSDALESVGSEMVESNCFYAVYAITDQFDQLLFDAKNLIDPSGEFKWFNLVAYNNIHLISNLSVNYEMCDSYVQLERLGGMLSGDFSLMVDMSSTNVVNMFSGGGEDLLEAVSAFTCADLDDMIDDAVIAGEALVKEGQELNQSGAGLSSSGKEKAEGGDWDSWESNDGEELSAEGQEFADKVTKKSEDMAEDFVDKLKDCGINYYEGGKYLGTFSQTAFKQQLDESKL